MSIYEVSIGPPSRNRLFTLALEAVGSYAMKFIQKNVKHQGEESIYILRSYLGSELPSSVLKEVLNFCLLKDKYHCNHNPTECSALELWRVFFHPKFTDVSVTHHEFAFPKTTNYPYILRNLDKFIGLILDSDPLPTITSFKLELQQCETQFLSQNKILRASKVLADRMRILAIPGLCTNELLNVIALHCTNLEVLNIQGSREQVDDVGFIEFLRCDSERKSRDRSVWKTLQDLDISRCTLSHQILFHLANLSGLRILNISTAILDEIHYSCEGHAVLQSVSGETLGLDKVGLPEVTQITVEHETIVQVSINKVMAYLQNIFPNAKNIRLENCIASELHVTLTLSPQIAFMRENIQSLELISADYFIFPRLIYPCPNLEELSIKKPTNDIFNIDQENVPFLYGNTIPFVNLKNLKLSRISLTNLTHFLSKSSNLKKFNVHNIGRRERPRWTDDRVKEIMSPTSVPRLEEFHVSCLPNEGFSTSEMHRYLHLTKETIRYLTHNFPHIKRITGIESWNPRESNQKAISSVLNSELIAGRFSLTHV